MTSQYTHRLTLAVPELLIPQANQLALAMGESAADVNTFTQASHEDADGNKYAVCSTVSKPIVLGALSAGLPDPLPSHAEGADITLAQAALDSIVQYSEGVTAEPSRIVLGIDMTPLEMFSSIGLTEIEQEAL